MWTEENLRAMLHPENRSDLILADWLEEHCPFEIGPFAALLREQHDLEAPEVLNYGGPPTTAPCLGKIVLYVLPHTGKEVPRTTPYAQYQEAPTVLLGLLAGLYDLEQHHEVTVELSVDPEQDVTTQQQQRQRLEALRDWFESLPEDPEAVYPPRETDSDEVSCSESTQLS